MRGLQERRVVAALSPRSHRRALLAAGVAAAVVVADVVTKSQAEAHLHHPVHLIGPLGLALGYNSGAAFSLFTGSSAVLVVVGVVLVGALVVAAVRTQRTAVALGLGLVLGGAMGNLGDRLVRGHHGDVVDFVTITHWPTFNVADSCISVGVVLLVACSWRKSEPTRAAT